MCEYCSALFSLSDAQLRVGKRTTIRSNISGLEETLIGGFGKIEHLNIYTTLYIVQTPHLSLTKTSKIFITDSVTSPWKNVYKFSILCQCQYWALFVPKNCISDGDFLEFLPFATDTSNLQIVDISAKRFQWRSYLQTWYNHCQRLICQLNLFVFCISSR